MDKEIMKELEVKKQIHELNVKSLETEEKILKMKYELKLLEVQDMLKRIIALGELLETISSKDFIEPSLAFKLTSKNKEFKNVFEFRDKKAFVRDDVFLELHNEYVYLEKELAKEDAYFENLKNK